MKDNLKSALKRFDRILSVSSGHIAGDPGGNMKSRGARRGVMRVLSYNLALPFVRDGPIVLT